MAVPATAFYESVTFDKTVNSCRDVMPASAGIQNVLKILDPGFRRDDGKSKFRAFYGAVKFNAQYIIMNS